MRSWMALWDMLKTRERLDGVLKKKGTWRACCGLKVLVKAC